jgi:hypothetical protein
MMRIQPPAHKLSACRRPGRRGRAGGRAAGRATAGVAHRDYWVYVGAESADLLHRIRFGPDGAVVERTISVGEIPTEMEGPHGLAISADGRYLHMTTGHGVPDGRYWRYELGPDTLVGPGTCSACSPPPSTSRRTASTPSP